MSANILIESFKFSPHPDIELGIPRREVEAFIARPASIGSAPLPLVITIPGYGEQANSEYFLNKLNVHLAEKYCCMVLSVNYHGINRVPSKFDFSHVPNLISELQLIYGWRPTSQLPNEAILEFIIWSQKQGIKKLPSSLKRFIRFEFPEYHSFGFLPALDHFSAIKELAKRYLFDIRRSILFGSSYGGYIANLMSKYAPNTFSMVIDNSGFLRSQLTDLLQEDLSDGYAVKDIAVGESSLGFPIIPTFPWNLDEMSSGYFSDARRGIRCLLNINHWTSSDTDHYIFHSVEDRTIPISEKDQLVELLRSKGRNVNYTRVDQNNLDGVAFKNLGHGMNASLRSLFAIAVPGEIHPIDTKTNYERESDVKFPCGSEIYRFKFFSDYDFKVEIESCNQIIQIG